MSAWSAKACVGPAFKSTSWSRCATCIAFVPSQCGPDTIMLWPPCCAAAAPSTFFIASWLSGPFAVPAFWPRGCPEAVLELSGSCPGMSGVVLWLSWMPFSPHRGVASTDASRGLLTWSYREGLLRPSWEYFLTIFENSLGALLGRFGTILGRLGALLDRFRALWRASWAVLRRSLGIRDEIRFVADARWVSLRSSWSTLGPSCPPLLRAPWSLANALRALQKTSKRVSSRSPEHPPQN